MCAVNLHEGAVEVVEDLEVALRVVENELFLRVVEIHSRDLIGDDVAVDASKRAVLVGTDVDGVAEGRALVNS